MKKSKLVLWLLLTSVTVSGAAFVHFTLESPTTNYPTRNIQGIIMWGAGGATDTMSRAITPYVEPQLNKEIVLINRSGGAGAISTKYVHNKKPDGYTLLYGAENPQLHGVLGLSDIDYSEFYAVNVLARGISVIVSHPDQPWRSLKELMDDVKARPKEIKMGSTGPGGLPYVVGAMLGSEGAFEVIPVPFDGDGPAITALLGGHVDFLPSGFTATAEHIRSGRLIALAVVNDKEISLLPSVPPITLDYPSFKKFLPWGPFYGVFINKQAPRNVKETLTKAFHHGASNPQFIRFVNDFGAIPMNISGQEADEFLRKWQSVTTWLLHDAGATKKSPTIFEIPRP
ncbi:MAG: tripartite tricarboxylate transporter substrate binding protein [Pseudomonadales bacterium]|nr:tripartite tricarboxylate transporter substrate binding protein [Pseudomonadales bacterium]